MKLNWKTFKTQGEEAYADVEFCNEQYWYIEMIESKRAGGGTEIIRMICEEALSKGVKEIGLATTEFSGWGFFDKMGFVCNNADNEPWDIPMTLFLHPPFTVPNFMTNK